MQTPAQIRSGWHRCLLWRGAGCLGALLLVLACAGRPVSAQDVGTLSGRVTNPQGQPLTVLVRVLSDGDIPAGAMYTDANGAFAFLALPVGIYTVVVEADGYKPFRQTARLDANIQPRVDVMVVLEPATQTTATNGPVIPGSKSTTEVKASHILPPLNPKAAKEFDKGNKAREDRDDSAALEHYQKALRIDPNFYPALNNLGAIYERQGNHSLAEQAFLKAQAIDPDDGESYINLGHVSYEEGQYRPAIERLNAGLQRSPDSAMGNFFLGSAYFKLHESQKAEPLLKRACALDPQHMAPAHLQLANLYLQRHDSASAKAELQIYLKLDPRSPQLAAIKKMLASLP